MHPAPKKGAKGNKDKGKGKQYKGGKGKAYDKGKGKGKAYDQHYDQQYAQGQGQGYRNYHNNRSNQAGHDDTAWRTLASHEAGLQRLDAASSLVVWVPDFVFADIEQEAKLWEEARDLPTADVNVEAEGQDGSAVALGGHPWGCGKADVRFQKLMEGVSKVLFNAELDGVAGDDSHLKLRALQGNEGYAPGQETEDVYLSAVKTAPEAGIVVDFTLMKGRARQAQESPYRVTFVNEPWGVYLKGFLTNLEVTPLGYESGWGIQRWRPKRH